MVPVLSQHHEDCYLRIYSCSSCQDNQQLLKNPCHHIKYFHYQHFITNQILIIFIILIIINILEDKCNRFRIYKWKKIKEYKIKMYTNNILTN